MIQSYNSTDTVIIRQDKFFGPKKGMGSRQSQMKVLRYGKSQSRIYHETKIPQTNEK